MQLVLPKALIIGFIAGISTTCKGMDSKKEDMPPLHYQYSQGTLTFSYQPMSKSMDNFIDFKDVSNLNPQKIAKDFSKPVLNLNKEDYENISYYTRMIRTFPRWAHMPSNLQFNEMWDLEKFKAGFEQVIDYQINESNLPHDKGYYQIILSLYPSYAEMPINLNIHLVTDQARLKKGFASYMNTSVSSPLKINHKEQFSLATRYYKYNGNYFQISSTFDASQSVGAPYPKSQDLISDLEKWIKPVLSKS